jgi:hypothetical protein
MESKGLFRLSKEPFTGAYPEIKRTLGRNSRREGSKKYLKFNKQTKANLWPESLRELYRQSNIRLSAELVPIFCG